MLQSSSGNRENVRVQWYQVVHNGMPKWLMVEAFSHITWSFLGILYLAIMCGSYQACQSWPCNRQDCGTVARWLFLMCTADLVSPKDAKEAAKKLLESGVRWLQVCVFDCRYYTVYFSFSSEADHYQEASCEAKWIQESGGTSRTGDFSLPQTVPQTRLHKMIACTLQAICKVHVVCFRLACFYTYTVSTCQKTQYDRRQ